IEVSKNNISQSPLVLLISRTFWSPFHWSGDKFVRFDGLGKIVDDEDDECNPVNFIDGIDGTHVRSMRNRKTPFSGGLVDIAVATASIFDEVSGDFSAQKPVKLNRLGYKVFILSLCG